MLYAHMIRRDGTSEFWVIAQHDHALLSGQLLAKLGNALFAPPTPFQAVINAASYHDSGWQPHDAHPRLNAQNRPSHVFEITIEIALAAWADSVATAVSEHPYSGLLVSLHAMALAAGAKAKTPAEAFHLQQFFQRQAQLQESLRKRLGMRTDFPLRCGLCEPGQSDDEDLLLTNFHLVQLVDQLSLILCFDHVVFDRIANVIPRPMGDPVTFRVDRPQPGVIRIDPWPFAVPKLDLLIPAKLLADRHYAGDFDIARACASATSEQLHATLKTWQEI
jgi:hypothetical protein